MINSIIKTKCDFLHIISNQVVFILIVRKSNPELVAFVFTDSQCYSHFLLSFHFRSHG